MKGEPSEAGHRALYAAVAVLAAAAVAALALLGSSPVGGLLFHDDLARAADTSPLLLAVVPLAGWTLMVVAMMLPTSLPLITLFRAVVRRRRDSALLVVLLIVGYLGTWTLFGGVVYLGGWVLQQIARQSGWLEANGWVLGAGIVTLAGLYQFTPLKYKCLEK